VKGFSDRSIEFFRGLKKIFYFIENIGLNLAVEYLGEKNVGVLTIQQLAKS